MSACGAWICANWWPQLRPPALAKGLTREAVEERSGFSQQYISDLDRGLRNPTVVTLYELAQAFDVNHVKLVTPDDQV
jgi:transcriptional regulator with XRE-family HTH domain